MVKLSDACVIGTYAVTSYCRRALTLTDKVRCSQTRTRKRVSNIAAQTRVSTMSVSGAGGFDLFLHGSFSYVLVYAWMIIANPWTFI